MNFIILNQLQQERQDIISCIKNSKNQVARSHYEEKLLKLQDKMATINKLENREKNLHVIWIGIPPENEFDNLKVWAKYNPDYAIRVWTDSHHILSYILGSLITQHTQITQNGISKRDYRLEAKLKDEFYFDYHLKNPHHTFDDNVQRFLIAKNWATTTQIETWRQNFNTRFEKELNELQTFTPIPVIFHDVAKEKAIIFSDFKYYEGYLTVMEHLQILPAASDRLRYAVLNHFGGCYLDTDAAVEIDYEQFENNPIIAQLVNEIEWNPNNDYTFLGGKKIEYLMNQINLLRNCNALNDFNLNAFALRWEKLLQGDATKTLENLKKIVSEINHNDFNFTPLLSLNAFPLNNFLGTIMNERANQTIANNFIVSKADAPYLKALMHRISMTDKKLKIMKTEKKLINQNEMILYSTGNEGCYYTFMKFDEHYFYQHPLFIAKMCNFSNIASFQSTWFCKQTDEDAITDETELRFNFSAHENDETVVNYKDRPEIKKILAKIKKDDLAFTAQAELWTQAGRDASLWFDNLPTPSVTQARSIIHDVTKQTLLTWKWCFKKFQEWWNKLKNLSNKFFYTAAKVPYMKNESLPTKTEKDLKDNSFLQGAIANSHNTFNEKTINLQTKSDDTLSTSTPILKSALSI